MAETPSDGALEKISRRYRDFSEREARGVSPLYEEFATHVADSEALVRFLSTLPVPKQQPNLLFAAVKFLYGTARSNNEFEEWIVSNADPIQALMLARTTQTNEPARCATILPVLARLPEPLALLEVGAAAGLCLLPDRYGYDYGGHRITPRGVQTDGPVFPCRASQNTPLPLRLPRVAWRGGLDLHPLDLTSSEDVRWLEALVWPGQEGRSERLRAAVQVAQESPPMVRKGDLLTDLEALVSTVPEDATLVIFHSAVLAYLAPEDWEKFRKQVQQLRGRWISNEAAGVFPAIDSAITVEIPRGRFILSVDGKPVAFTGPHGQAIQWIEEGC